MDERFRFAVRVYDSSKMWVGDVSVVFLLFRGVISADGYLVGLSPTCFPAMSPVVDVDSCCIYVVGGFPFDIILTSICIVVERVVIPVSLGSPVDDASYCVPAANSCSVIQRQLFFITWYTLHCVNSNPWFPALCPADGVVAIGSRTACSRRWLGRRLFMLFFLSRCSSAFAKVPVVGIFSCSPVIQIDRGKVRRQDIFCLIHARVSGGFRMHVVLAFAALSSLRVSPANRLAAGNIKSRNASFIAPLQFVPFHFAVSSFCPVVLAAVTSWYVNLDELRAYVASCIFRRGKIYRWLWAFGFDFFCCDPLDMGLCGLRMVYYYIEYSIPWALACCANYDGPWRDVGPLSSYVEFCDAAVVFTKFVTWDCCALALYGFGPSFIGGCTSHDTFLSSLRFHAVKLSCPHAVVDSFWNVFLYYDEMFFFIPLLVSSYC